MDQVPYASKLEMIDIYRFLSHLDVDVSGNVDLRKSVLGYLITFARVAVA